MERLTDYFPYENTAPLDYDRPLKWCNDSILHAIEYYKIICKEMIDYDQLTQELRNGSLRAVQALLFGAMKAADNKIDTKRYAQIYKPNNLTDYVTSVMDGMANFLPVPEIKDNGKNLDESWPDTQAELKKKESTKRRTGASGSGFAKRKGSISRTKR